jgi:protein O-mannosyl-transferase
MKDWGWLTNVNAFVVIFIVGITVFFNCLGNKFVWDDYPYFIQNIYIQKASTLSLFGANDFNNTGQYRPIPAIYFATLFRFFGNTPFYYHVVQLVMHFANTMLVFIVFAKFFDRRLALFLCLVFLVHPMQVESVSYIAAAGNILFFTFGSLALLLGLDDKVDWLRWLAICLLLLMSFFTKETGLLFLVVIVAAKLIFRRGLVMLTVLCGAVVTAVYFCVRIVVGRVLFDTIKFVAIGDLPIRLRLVSMPAVIGYYIKTFFLPAQLVIDQRWVVRNIYSADFLLSLLTLFELAVSAMLFGKYLFETNKKLLSYLLYFGIWFGAGMAMHSQLFPLDMTVADRWFYFPMVGLLGIVGVVLTICVRNFSTKGMVLLAAIVVATLSVRTFVRNSDWRDELTLYKHDVGLTNNDYDLKNNLSVAYLKNYNCDEAKKIELASISEYPYVYNYMNLGVSNYCLGDYMAAKDAYLKALQYGENFQVYDHLANLGLVYGDAQENRDFIESHALKKFPEDWKLWLDMAILDYKLGKTSDAKKEAERASSYDLSGTAIRFYSAMLSGGPLDVNVKFGNGN